jgi:uncharacterized repeat protein (TIGR03803 family)
MGRVARENDHGAGRVYLPGCNDEKPFHSVANRRRVYNASVFEANGSLYGTASSGGANDLGVVWKITP